METGNKIFVSSGHWTVSAEVSRIVVTLIRGGGDGGPPLLSGYPENENNEGNPRNTEHDHQ